MAEPVDLEAWDLRTATDITNVEDEVDPDNIGDKYWLQMSLEECSDEMVALLLRLKHNDKLSAKSLCLICFWASRASATGKVSSIAYHPTKNTSSYQWHLDKVLATGHEREKARYTNMEVPVHQKWDGSRGVVDIPARPIHEALVENLIAHPDAESKLAYMHNGSRLPPCNYENPVVERVGNSVYPCAIYMDAARFGNKDSVFAETAVNLCTGVRLLISVLRKGEFCRRGCKGRCTLFPLMLLLKWGHL